MQSTRWKRPSGNKGSKLEQTVLQGIHKSLISRSGRRGSNPRRPAWENNRRSFIKDLAAIEVHQSTPCSPSFREMTAKGVKTESRKPISILNQRIRIYCLTTGRFCKNIKSALLRIGPSISRPGIIDNFTEGHFAFFTQKSPSFNPILYRNSR